MVEIRPKRMLKELLDYLTLQRQLQNSDILLASFPKSGNTWVRFIWANIVSLMDLDGQAVDYDLLNGGLVAEYDSNSYGKIEYNALPRLVKTHWRYNSRRFGRHRAIYLMRHPGDTMVSYYEYRRHYRDPQKRPGSFKDFIRSPEFGLPAWREHILSWSSVATVVLRYEALWEDAFSTMKTSLAKLELDDIPDDILKTAVERSDFRQVRSLEESKGLNDDARRQLSDDFHFARRGEPGQWREYFDADDSRFLYRLLSDVNDPGYLNDVRQLIDGST